MDLSLSNKVLKIARNEIAEDKLYKLWLVELQSMDKHNYIDFEQYKKNSKLKQMEKNNNKKEKKKTLEDLETEANKLIELDKKGLLLSQRESMFD